MTEDEIAVRALIVDYHQAIRDGDVDKTLACTGGEIFEFQGDRSNDPLTWTAIGIGTEEDMRSYWEEAPDDFVYEIEVEVLNVSISPNGLMAIAVVDESGHCGSDSDTQRAKTEGCETNYFNVRWEKYRNVWFCSKASGAWKIVGEYQDPRRYGRVGE